MPIEYGIHFGLDEAEYHKLPCLSTSALKTLEISVNDFWDQSWMNPDRPEQEEKAHLEFGKVVHSYVLEPETVSKYAQAFMAPEGCIKTVDDIKLFLDKKEVKYKSSLKKADLINLLLETDPEAPVYDLLEKKYYDANPGKIFIPIEEYSKLEVMQKCLSAEKAFMEYFQDGMAEVTLIWPCPITGVKMKSRLDFLSLHISDLKTFSKKSKQPIDNIVKSAFIHERYDLQFYTYNLARDIVFKGLMEGRYIAHGEHNPEWLRYIVDNYNDSFYFGFVESSRPYNVRILDVDRWRKQDEEHNMLFLKAEDTYEKAVRKFEYCMKTFGPDTPWREENIVIRMTDRDLPMWFLESK